MDAIRALVDIIAASPISITIQSISWLIPIVQSIHIIAIAAVMASAVLLNTRIAGLANSSEGFDTLLGRYLPWVWRALPVLAISGIILIIGEPERELMSYVFWIKMALLIVALSLCAMIARAASPQPLADLSPETRGRLRVLALLCLTALVGIIACGRLIAYA